MNINNEKIEALPTSSDFTFIATQDLNNSYSNSQSILRSQHRTTAQHRALKIVEIKFSFEAHFSFGVQHQP